MVQRERHVRQVAGEAHGRGQLMAADHQVEHEAGRADRRDAAAEVRSVEEARVGLVLDEVADADEPVPAVGRPEAGDAGGDVACREVHPADDATDEVRRVREA